MTKEHITMRTATRLAQVVELAMSGSRITWSPDEGETLYHGTARGVCDENFGLLPPDASVLDAYMRVTGRTGVEHLLSVRDLVEWVGSGSLVGRWVE